MTCEGMSSTSLNYHKECAKEAQQKREQEDKQLTLLMEEENGIEAV